MYQVSRKKNGGIKEKKMEVKNLILVVQTNFFGIMIPTPICIHHQRRQKYLDPILKRRSPLPIRRYLSQSQVIIVVLLGWKECIKHKAGAITSLDATNTCEL
nr:hypothetical protein CFP56_01756 [Quercus suber]